MVWLGLVLSIFLSSLTSFAESPVVDAAKARQYAVKCVRDGRNCAYTLRYQAQPDTIEYVAKKLYRNCIESDSGEASAQGASECSILAVYLLKNRNQAKAVEVLRKDCATNAPGCLILSAVLEFQNKEEAANSAAKFCDIALNAKSTDDALFSLAKRQCPATNGGRLGISQLHAEGRSILRSYLKEQKR
jgi:hypothetical protein